MSDVCARLEERQRARLAVLEQKKAQEREGKREEETFEYFSRELEARKTAITCLLTEAERLDKADLPLHFEQISSECQQLQKLVTNSTVFLTSYDLKTAQKQLTDLLQLVSTKQEEFFQPKKFSFSSRLKKAAPKSVAKIEVQNSDPARPGKDQPSSLSNTNSKVIADKQGLKLEMTTDEVKGQDIHLSNLCQCNIRLFGTPSTLHMTNMTSCTVLCGPVSGSVFVEQCSDCTFVVPCQQLRVHSTHSTRFFLHVTSRAIIEDSRQLTFAPYSWTYPEIETDFQSAGLDQSVNNWDQVDDFNWLASQEPSPNWSVLPQEQRTDFS